MWLHNRFHHIRAEGNVGIDELGLSLKKRQDCEFRIVTHLPHFAGILVAVSHAHKLLANSFEDISTHI